MTSLYLQKHVLLSNHQLVFKQGRLDLFEEIFLKLVGDEDIELVVQAEEFVSDLLEMPKVMLSFFFILTFFSIVTTDNLHKIV